MCSVDGEAVDLSDPVVVSDNVEVWLGTLATAMCSTLRQQLGKVPKLEEPFAQAPGQVLGLHSVITFTRR
jgi:hypothetical protein